MMAESWSRHAAALVRPTSLMESESFVSGPAPNEQLLSTEVVKEGAFGPWEQPCQVHLESHSVVVFALQFPNISVVN